MPLFRVTISEHYATGLLNFNAHNFADLAEGGRWLLSEGFMTRIEGKYTGSDLDGLRARGNLRLAH